MEQKISKVLYSVFCITLAILCLVSLLRIARAIQFKESSDLCTYQKKKAWYFIRISVICKLLVVVSHKAFSILPEVFRFLSLHGLWLWANSQQNPQFLNNWSGLMDKTETSHAWGPQIESGHGQVLLEWKINSKIIEQVTSDLRW